MKSFLNNRKTMNIVIANNVRPRGIILKMNHSKVYKVDPAMSIAGTLAIREVIPPTLVANATEIR